MGSEGADVNLPQQHRRRLLGGSTVHALVDVNSRGCVLTKEGCDERTAHQRWKGRTSWITRVLKPDPAAGCRAVSQEAEA
eukprot:10869747-Lingulodinium_polyedra.AAC.1